MILPDIWQYGYHTSPSVNRDSILRRGLLTMKPSNSWGSGLEDQPTGVYLMKDEQIAEEWPKSSLVTFSDMHPYKRCDTFDLYRVFMDRLSLVANEILTDPALEYTKWAAQVILKDIPTNCIELVKQDIEWDIHS